jgi:hypothetical protein
LASSPQITSQRIRGFANRLRTTFSIPIFSVSQRPAVAKAFLAIFAAHALYSGVWAASAPAGWADADISASAAGPPGLSAYWRGQDYFVGFSYALEAAFATWAVSRCISFTQGRAVTAGAAVGSITLVGVLMAAGCFFDRCCGSPMLAIYMGLFGAKVLGLGKPLTALITLVSIGCCYWCLSSRFARGECINACCCRSSWMSIHSGQERSMDVGASLSERRCNVSKLPMANNRPARSIRLCSRNYKRFHRFTRLTR